MHLLAHEGEARAELQQELADVVQKSALQVALGRVGAERQEIEVVGITDDLGREVRLRSGERVFEVGDGLALALVQAGLDPVREHGARPAVGDGLPGVPETDGRVFEFFQQDDVVTPRDFCNRLWHNSSIQNSRRLREF